MRNGRNKIFRRPRNHQIFVTTNYGASLALVTLFFRGSYESETFQFNGLKQEQEREVSVRIWLSASINGKKEGGRKQKVGQHAKIAKILFYTNLGWERKLLITIIKSDAAFFRLGWLRERAHVMNRLRDRKQTTALFSGAAKSWKIQEGTQ